MSNMPEGVSMLNALERDPTFSGTPEVRYPNLVNRAERAQERFMGLFRAFLAAEEGSVEEEAYAREAAICGLVQTADVLNSGRAVVTDEETGIIAERLTQASVEIYGGTEEPKFQRFLGAQINEFRSYRGNQHIDQEQVSTVLALLEPHAAPDPIEAHEQTDSKEVAQTMANAMQALYGDVLAVFDTQNADTLLSAEMAGRLFEAGLNCLITQDPSWYGWQVVAKDAVSFEADGKTKTISIGMRHASMTVSEAKGLFCHEVLVHAVRSVQGEKLDGLLGDGLAGYLDAEEGLAIILQQGYSGKTNANRDDRYVDFGLGLPHEHGAPLNPDELHTLYVARRIVRAQAKGINVDTEQITRDGWRHINRICRGRRDTITPVINTKDLAYGEGFDKMSAYLTAELAAGRDPRELLTYLLQGKFDPTNQRHVAYLQKKMSEQVSR